MLAYLYLYGMVRYSELMCITISITIGSRKLMIFIRTTDTILLVNEACYSSYVRTYIPES